MTCSTAYINAIKAQTSRHRGSNHQHSKRSLAQPFPISLLSII